MSLTISSAVARSGRAAPGSAFASANVLKCVNLSTFVSTLIKKTDGEQSPPCRHCERSEAISKELSHAHTRLLRALPIAMTLIASPLS